MEPDNVYTLFDALRDSLTVKVQTATRTFEGVVMEIRKSPFTSHIASTVVDSEGRVHNFYATKEDCQVTVLGPLLR
jgi:hypothetical protein